MEGDALMKKEYDELLAQYSRKRGENENEEKVQKEINQAIIRLEQELQKVPQVVVENRSAVNAEQASKIAELTQQIQELTAILRQEEEYSLQPLPISAEINNVASAHAALKVNLQKINESSSKGKQVTQDVNLLSDLKNKNKQKQFQIQMLIQDIRQEQLDLAQLQRQLGQLQHNQKTHSDWMSDSNGLKLLQEESAQLERELKQLDESDRIVKQQQFQRQRVEQTAKRDQENEINSLRHHNSQLTLSKKKYEEELANLDASLKDRSLHLQKERKGLEQDVHKKSKDVQSLKKQISEKRVQDERRRSEQKNKKKEKPRNFKQQMSDAQTLQQVFSRELKREKDKVVELSQIKKTYASHQSLQILQRELERHQATNRPSLAAEEARKERILKDNQLLKSRIQYLKKSTTQMEEESLRQATESKVRGDVLVNQKLAHEKLSKQVTGKLNDYMKEYPDHERNKEQKKNEEKRVKHELKQKEKEKSRLQREKIKETKVSHEVVEESSENGKGEDLNKAAWEQWKQWDNSGTVGKETSLFKNRQFQIACGVVALIAIVLLIYGV